LEHVARDVDPLGPPHNAGERADDEATAARDVEHGVAGAGAAGLDEETQRVLAGDRRGGGEGRGLTRELIDDQVAMARGAHRVALLCRRLTTRRVRRRWR